MLRCLLICIFWGVTAHGILSDGHHATAEYVNLSNSEEAFDAACLVINHTHHAAQTGVLVSPTLIATAAHGVSRYAKSDDKKTDKAFIEKKCVGLYVKFADESTYEVESIYIDRRFFEGEKLHQNKNDIAFLKLKQKVCGRRIAKIVDDFYFAPDLNSATVVTFGTMDLKLTKTMRRAFRLYEFSEYHIGDAFDDSKDHYGKVSYSSIYFDPMAKLDNICINSNADLQRSADALKHYQENPGPTGLALPGTSGAPVFIKIYNPEMRQDEWILWGIVTSFAPTKNMQNFFLDDKNDAATYHPKFFQNNFQTNFSSFYLQSFLTHDFKRGPHHKIDPELQLLLDSQLN
jgi:hypothetical protein